MPRPRRLLRKLALSALSLLAAACVLELVLRAREPGPFSFFDRNPYVDSPVDKHVRHAPGFRGRWDSTWYEIDSRGFRGPERAPGPDQAELRILCLGDSCTFGKGVLEPDTWPRQLETQLRAANHDALVFNAGINGAHGRVYRQMAREHTPTLAPDVVVVGYNINDFPNAIQAVDVAVFEERKLRRLLPQGLRDALGRTALYRKVRQVYYDTQKEADWAAAEAAAKRAAAEPLDSEVWDRQRALLADLKAITEAGGARLMVFLFPYESQVYLEAFDDAPIRRLAELCGSLELPFFDLAAEFRSAARAVSPAPSLFIPGDRYHPNALGYSIVAQRVLAVMRERGWVPAP